MNNNRILLLDPSIASDNVGDEIIMECVGKELNEIINNRFTYHIPTHLPTFHWYAVLKNSTAVKNYANCALKFVCGSNLLMKNMLTHYPQWNINYFNCAPLVGSILVGVGASAGEKTNTYTRRLYNKFLNKEYYHSVRDQRSKDFMDELGLKSINTGCATMWMLTPEHCAKIPTKKSSRVIFTLTGTHEPLPSDQALIDILQRNYEEVYFWEQGALDFEYIHKFHNIEGIKFIAPTKEAYHNILSEDNLDYVGTRLHAGVYAMRHFKRSIIIVIDERAREINKSNNLICMERNAVASELEALINSEFPTNIKMPFDAIKQWKDQFLT